MRIRVLAAAVIAALLAALLAAPPLSADIYALPPGSGGGGSGGGGTAGAPSYTSAAPLIVTGSTITRPANTTAYAFGGLVANSTVAGSVVPGSFVVARATNQTGNLLSVQLNVSSTVLTNGQFRIHFYSASPTVSNGDGAAWITPSSGDLGSMDVTVDRVMTDGAIGFGGPSFGNAIAFTPAAGTSTIYYLIEARAAYTPISSETLTPILTVQ